MKTEAMQTDKEYHEQLAGVIKGAHARLRHQYKQNGGEWEEAWRGHCEDEAGLQEYAQAMYHLATDVWVKRPKTRIHWCADTCARYFQQGGLQRVLDKEVRRREHESKQEAEAGREGDTEHASSVGGEREAIEPQYVAGPLTEQDQMRLLDVGSCYNPFDQFDRFIAIGLDLSPALPNVHKCDFLQLHVTAPVSCDTATFTSLTSALPSPVTALPSNSFHVLVFSLLLEYLPSPTQRWRCCEKARELLMYNGLLVIVTPDSHHQNKNQPMMKAWRRALEGMGFQRYFYEKDEHLHCMAYRKVNRCETTSELDPGDIGPHLLYIPQDRSEDSEESSEASVSHSASNRTEQDSNIAEGFENLPLYDDD